MKIAQVAPLYESVPPRYYGGTERVVFNLTEELVRLGHEVTLFASGDSRTSARLASPVDRAVRLDPDCRDPFPPHVLMSEMLARAADDFDVIHSHAEYLPFPVLRRVDRPVLVTLHNRLDLPEYAPLYREYREFAYVSISDSHREPLPDLNWAGTVYHGLREERFAFNPGPGRYLAFLGRMSREKRPDRAIEIAKRTGMPLKMAAKIGDGDREYFERDIRPLLEDPLIQYIGEIGEDEKNEFLGNASALLFHIDWPEPFGLVMIEALACGTPVIASRKGSVPEIIEQGRTGFVVDSLDEAVRAAGLLGGLDRQECRRSFEKRFTARRMTQDYLKIYERLLAAAPAGSAGGNGREHLLH